MKRVMLIIVIMVQGIIANSQVELKRETIDEFTGVGSKVTTTQKDNSLIFFGAGITDTSGKYYALYFGSRKELGCAGVDDNYVIFLFTDETTLKLTDDLSDIDCKDGALSTYMISEEDLAILSSRKIKKVRLAQSEYYDDVELKNQSAFIQIIELIK